MAILAGCASAGASQPLTAEAAASRAPVASAPSSLRDADWGRLRLSSLALELQLPEIDAWRRGRGSGWLQLVHAGSNSVLEFWLQRAERLVRPADCESRARLERPDLFREDAEAAIDRQTLAVPAGFRTELVVSISVSDPGAGVAGHILAFGAAAGRCLAVHFTTRAHGAGADAEIGRRLGIVAGEVIPSLRLLGVEDRVGPKQLR